MNLKRVLVSLSKRVKAEEITYEEAEQQLVGDLNRALLRHRPGRPRRPGIPLSIFSAIQHLRANPLTIDLERLRGKVEATRRV